MDIPRVDARSVADWIRSRPVRSVLVIVLGSFLGGSAFIATTVYAAFLDVRGEVFEVQRASEQLEERTDEEVDRSFEQYLEDEANRLREEYDEALTRQELDALVQQQIDEIRQANAEMPDFGIPNVVSPVLPDEMFDTFLLLGSDEGGFRADVIIYVMLPSDGSDPIVASIPRDLYIGNECTGGLTRANAGLGGCRGLAGGLELMAINIGTYTGVEVDHVARVNFGGFAALVDRLGGVSICVGSRPIRDRRSDLELGAGCHWVGGETALAWVRSRSPEVLVDGEWVERAGSDFDRQRKERDLLFQMADRLLSYSSLGSLTTALSNLSSAVRIDESLSIGEAAQIAFNNRNVDLDDVDILSVPTSDYRTSGGALVLIPQTTFNDALSAIYPPAGAG